MAETDERTRVWQKEPSVSTAVPTSTAWYSQPTLISGAAGLPGYAEAAPPPLSYTSPLATSVSLQTSSDGSLLPQLRGLSASLQIGEPIKLEEARSAALGAMSAQAATSGAQVSVVPAAADYTKSTAATTSAAARELSSPLDAPPAEPRSETSAAPRQASLPPRRELSAARQTSSIVTGEATTTSTRIVHTYLDYANQRVTETVVRRETGEARTVSVTERRDESRKRVVSERFVEHTVSVPKRSVREKTEERVEKVYETIRSEEIVEDHATVHERVIEYGRPQIREKVIETPELVYQEREVAVVETRVQERPQYVERVVKQERVVEKPVPQIREQVVSIPDIQQRDVPVEVVKYVDEIVDQVRTHEVRVPRTVEVPVPQVVEVEAPVDVERALPVCVEAELTAEIRVPELRPRYHKVNYAVYLPKFIEVPAALELMSPALQADAAETVAQVAGLTKTAASLCDIEALASNIMKQNQAATAAQLMTRENLQAALVGNWNAAALAAAAPSAAVH